MTSPARALLLSLALALPAAGCGPRKDESRNSTPPGPADATPQRSESRPAAPPDRRVAPADGRVAPTDRAASPANATPPRAATAALPATEAALVDAAQAALASGRFEAMERLLVRATMFHGCDIPQPHFARLEREIQKVWTKTRRKFAHCLALGDWKTARRLAQDPRKPRMRPIFGCTRVQKPKDIWLTYQLGARKVRVKIDDPAKVEGQGWAVVDGISCRLVTE